MKAMSQSVWYCWKVRGILLGALAIWMSACADGLQDDVRLLRPVESALGVQVLDNLERRAQEQLASLRHPMSPGAAAAVRPELRTLLAASLGINHLPWPPDPQAQVVGTVSGQGYLIEKIIYQTLPETQVPAHLYLPENRQGRLPGILFYPGHWRPDSKARPDFQAFCINMARLGFVVLNFDPFGQGERGVSRRDHRRTESLLLGISQQGFAVYESRVALEYLLGRDEVDPSRIGMTGASGGGYNTWMMAALDDRIKVAVPVVGTSEFFEQIEVCRPLDWYGARDHCHFVPDLIQFANNHELVSMISPRPLLIVAASEDQSFPVEGVRRVSNYGKQLYSAWKVPEKIGYSEDASTGHGYQQKKREAAYGWFLRWLTDRGDGTAYPEPPTETLPYDADELRCFVELGNQPAGPGMTQVIGRLAKDTTPAWTPDSHEIVFGQLPEVESKSLEIGEEKIQRLEIQTESDLIVPAFLIDSGSRRGLLIAVNDQGKEAALADPLVDSASRKGWAVCGIDPRGMGEMVSDKPGWAFAVSLLLGENFVWRQAWDLGVVVDALARTDRYRDGPIVVYGRGHGASLAVTYLTAQFSQRNAVDVPITAYVIRDCFTSYLDFIDRPVSVAKSFLLATEEEDPQLERDEEIPMTYFAFDALRHFDLSDLLSALPEIRGYVINPVDGDWNPQQGERVQSRLGTSVEVKTEVAPDQPGLDIALFSN